MRNITNTLLKLKQTRYPWMQIFAVLIVILPMFIDGLLYGLTSPFIPVLISPDSPIPMSLDEASYLTVIPPLAGIISCPIFAKLLNVIGRKRTILLMAIPQFASWMMIAFADSLVVLYVARVMGGIAQGGNLIAAPVYIGEIVEPKLRGTLGSFLSFAVYFGQFLINVIGSYVTMGTTALICGIFPVLFVVLFLSMPESPYYYLMKDQFEDARSALRRLRIGDNIEDELETLKNDVCRQLSEPNSIKDLFRIDSNRRAVLIAVGLRIAHQLSGFSAFGVYTQYLFEKAGGNVTQTVAAMIFTGVQCIAVVVILVFVDRFGRKPLMIFSSLSCGLVLTVETVYFYFQEYTNIDVSFLGWIPVTGMILYIVSFCVGFGIVPTLMLSELFSASIKGEALCLMSIFFSLCISITTKMFQVMAESLGLFGPFCLYSICCYASVLFSIYCVPETKGKSLEEIQQQLKGKQDTSNNVNTTTSI